MSLGKNFGVGPSFCSDHRFFWVEFIILLFMSRSRLSLDQKIAFESKCRGLGKACPQWGCEEPRRSAGDPPVPPAAPAGEPPVPPAAPAGEVNDSPMEEDAGEGVAEGAGGPPVADEPPAAGPPAAAAGGPPVGDATVVPKAAESPSPGAEGGGGEDAAMAPAVSPAAVEDLSPASGMDDEDAEADFSGPAADAAVAAVAAEPAVGAAAEPATYVAEAASDRYIDCQQCGLPTAPKLCTFGLCQTCCDRRPAPASGEEKCAFHFFAGAGLNTGDSLPPMPPVAP